jgi:3-deoxy-D-manno-octulosonic-acid transferase
MIATAYRALATAAAPALRMNLAWRARHGKEIAARLPERFGIASRPRPAGRVVWIHAASLGESASVVAVIERLLARDPGLHAVVTTGTVTSATFLEQRLPSRALHQFVPLDSPGWVRRFLDHWRPDLALWVESELWPCLIGQTQARGIPMALLNGRISARSFERWRRFNALLRPALAGFAVVLGQDGTQSARFAALGARQVKCLGNLKFAAAPPPADTDELARLRAVVGTRPVWLAASTHPGEEAQIAAAHRRTKARFPDLLTIVVPRHAVRGAEVRATLAGLAVAQRSRNEAIETGTEIYLADTMGELGTFYRLAPIVFLGGSLVGIGGHNPVEPAQLGCCILSGPVISNFTAVYERFCAAGAAAIVKDADTLSAAIVERLANPQLVQRTGEAAMAVAASEASVLDAVLAELATLLPPPGAPADARA